ncbi:MAG: 1-acyl-sn-glycerol-3-phosphate acyltransferase, partial [Kiritimatiellia bacterium]
RLPKPADLIAGNALVEMGTYFSVVFGIILATLLFEIPNYGLYILGASVVIIAILGWLAARAAPQLPAENPDLKVAKEPFTATWRAAKIVFSKKNLAMAVLANSWFWALGAGVLSMFPTFVRDSLGGGAAVQTLLTVMFSVGIALGSLACVRLSKGRIEMGLVFFGSIGISVFLADIWFGNMTAHADTEHLMGVVPFFQQWQAWRLTIDLLGVSASGGFFMVPLYTYLQHHGEVGDRGQLIGALNIINAALIVAGQIVIMGLIIAGLSEAFLFFVIAIANLLVAFAIYRWLPERPARLLLQWAVGAMYRHNVIDRHNVPSEGAALIICNHISYLDWAILMAGTQRKHRFVIDLEMSKIPLAGTLARHCEVIPTTSDTSKRQVIVRSFKQISAALRNGELVVVFPEGALPYEADLAPFMRGLQLILKRDPVPVVPMAINGMWGSMYSRNNGRAFRSWRPPFRKIWLTVGEPIDPEDVTLTDLEDAVRELWKRKPSDP